MLNKIIRIPQIIKLFVSGIALSFGFFSTLEAQRPIVRDTFGMDSLAVLKLANIDTAYNRVIYRNLFPVYLGDTIWLKKKFQYNWAEAFVRRDQLFLGTPGSSTLPVFYTPHKSLGFDSGLNAFDFYHFDSDKIHFYRTTIPKAILYYNQGNKKEKNTTYAEFAREFNGPTGLSLRYRRINDMGEYSNQQQLHTSFEVGGYIFTKDEVFKTFLSVGAHTFNSQDNGGITTDTLYGDGNFDDRIGIPVQSSTAQTQDKGWEVRMTNHYNFFQDKPNPLVFQQDIHYEERQYKFSDPSPDTSYYKDFGAPDIGWRQFMRWRTFSHKLITGIQIKGSRFPADINFGFDFHRNWIDHEPYKFKMNNFFILGSYRQKLGNIGNLNVDLKFDILDQAGTYNAKGQLDINAEKIGDISVGLQLGNYEPSRIQLQFNTYDGIYWENDFSRYQVNTLFGIIKLKSFPFQWIVRNHIIQKAIYYDQNRDPVQLSGTSNITQTGFIFQYKFGVLITENEYTLQWSSEPEIRLPAYFGRTYLGVELDFFKDVLKFNVGGEVRVMETYNGNGYFPLTGQFHQSNSTVNFKYRLDGILGFQIEKFVFNFRFQNMGFIWDKEIRYFIENYPLADNTFRIGIGWEMFN